MNKKIFSLILASMGFAMLFTACGEKPIDQTQTDQTQTDQTQNDQTQNDQTQNDQNQNNQNNSQNDGQNQNQENEQNQNQSDQNQNQSDQNQNSQEKDENTPSKPEKEPEPEKHEHSYTWTVTKEPKCLTEGEETGKCACGDVQTRKLDKLGHDFGNVLTDSDGALYRICSRCSTRDEITDKEIDRKVNIGDTMFNFLVKDATKDVSEYLRFDEIRKGKKLVYLDFFFVGCGPCENMLRSQLSWYQNLDPKVREQFLMIMIDTNNESPETVNNHRKRIGIPDDIIMIAQGGQIFRNVVNTGTVPYGLYVDETGKVLKNTRGADLKSMIETYIEKGTTSTASEELIADPSKLRFQRA